MKIDNVDFFYLAMPRVTTDADGSQDALLVRVQAGSHVGWGECEASPLTCIASYVCPMSHGACRPVAESVLGQPLNDPSDIARIRAAVQFNSMDLLQAAHTFSGIEIALWDALGKRLGEPVYRLLGYKSAAPKLAYASQLFGNTPAETEAKAKAAREAGFRAVKFGWVNYGRGSVAEDAAHIEAARAGMGSEAEVLIDAGQIFAQDVEAAAKRLPALERFGVLWLEEPFLADALAAYGALADRSRKVGMAGGEGCHSAPMALNLIDFGKVGFVQIDTGRIGGLGPAKEVADHAVAKGVTFVNHTFTSHLALSASIQPYAGLADHRIAEYPFAPRALARDLTVNHIMPDKDGMIRLPDGPGLAMTVNTAALRPYLKDVEIAVAGRTLFRSSALPV
ncbi:MAG TPA: mandelate racemase/muconate lactonizing enzyme family protein [Dongiaceae bacterium]|nr:mandelate racemase/muconate lactonizing enzyme family protein [Dongiaceae bacterium]